MSPRTVEDSGGSVVGLGSILTGGEGSEPFTGSFTGLSDLSHPLAPASLPDTMVSKFVVVRATFGAFALAVVIRCCAGSGGGGFGFLGMVRVRLVRRRRWG